MRRKSPHKRQELYIPCPRGKVRGALAPSCAKTSLGVERYWVLWIQISFSWRCFEDYLHIWIA